MTQTIYQQHINRWKDCRKCSLCDGRNKVVFARGKIPCDILFVGEAPGVSENVTGDPFDGPAGQKLDEIIGDALARAYEAPMWLAQNEWPLRIAYYNLVGCFPKDAKETGNHEPPIEAIKACAPKLKEFVELCRPKLIVMVGSLSQKWTPVSTERIKPHTKEAVQWASIVHPAAILRAPLAQQSLMVKKSIVTLVQAIRSL